MTGRRQIARVPEPETLGGIEWLVLEHDLADSKGWFLYFHRSLDEPCEVDNWYLTMEEAVAQAETWGIHADDWKDI